MSSWRETDDKRGAILAMWRPVGYECAICNMGIREREMRHILELSSVDGSGRRDPPWECAMKVHIHERCMPWVTDALRLLLGRQDHDRGPAEGRRDRWND